MTHEFNFTQNNQDDIVLQYDNDDLDLQGELYLQKLIKDSDSVDEALIAICNGFWKEAQINVASILTGATNPYFIKLLRDNENVIAMAENSAIETFKGI